MRNRTGMKIELMLAWAVPTLCNCPICSCAIFNTGNKGMSAHFFFSPKAFKKYNNQRFYEKHKVLISKNFSKYSESKFT